MSECHYTMCSNPATEARTVGLDRVRTSIMVCAMHAKHLDQGGPIAMEFVKVGDTFGLPDTAPSIQLSDADRIELETLRDR